MRKRGAAAAAIAAALAVILTGCVPPAPKVIPTSDPTTTPIFATDADALAAAKVAYEGYLAASDAIGNDGGANPQRIASWVTARRLPLELKDFATFKKTGERLTGASRFTKLTSQQLTQSASGDISMSVYVCDDVSKSRLVDRNGRDITPKSRPSVVALQVNFKNKTPQSKTLVVDGSEPWSGSDFCS